MEDLVKRRERQYRWELRDRAANPERYRDKSTRWRRAHPEAARAKVRKSATATAVKRRQQLYLGRACEWCGRTGVRLLYHHRDPEDKVRNVGAMLNRDEALVLAEVAKCDLICYTCHRRHHRGAAA